MKHSRAQQMSEPPAKGRGSDYNYRLLRERILAGEINPYYAAGRKKLYEERLAFQLTGDQRAWLDAQAEDRGLSVAAVLRILIDAEVFRELHEKSALFSAENSQDETFHKPPWWAAE